jgi:hypothetical protein
MLTKNLAHPQSRIGADLTHEPPAEPPWNVVQRSSVPASFVRKKFHPCLRRLCEKSFFWKSRLCEKRLFWKKPFSHKISSFSLIERKMSVAKIIPVKDSTGLVLTKYTEITPTHPTGTPENWVLDLGDVRAHVINTLTTKLTGPIEIYERTVKASYVSSTAFTQHRVIVNSSSNVKASLANMFSGKAGVNVNTDELWVKYTNSQQYSYESSETKIALGVGATILKTELTWKIEAHFHKHIDGKPSGQEIFTFFVTKTILGDII